jgi:hypothetical protein
MKRKLYFCIVVVFSLQLVGTTSALAAEVEEQVKKAKEELISKARECKAIVADALGTPFGEQIKKAMDDLKKDPRNLKLEMKVIDVMLGQSDRLTNSLHRTKDADLVAIRDRVVKGLEALASSQSAMRDQYLTRAKESKDPGCQKRYEELGQACDRFARAYALRAEQYKAIPITQKLMEIQFTLEYLDAVKQVLVSLKEGIIPILSDETALRELQQLTTTIDDVQNSLKTFSEVVLAGALAGDESPKTVPEKSQPKNQGS